MKIIVPITITESMIGAATTVVEPATGETEWVSAGTYALGDLRIRKTTHRVYECVQASTGRTELPENDTAYWLDKEPTQRFAPFDVYKSTAATGTTSMTFVLSPGFFSAVALYGLTGSGYDVTVKDAPGGTVIKSFSGKLYRKGPSWYNYLFGERRTLSKVVLSGIPLRPTAELTVTITAVAGQPVGIGMIVCGHLLPLIDRATDYGGTQKGASAEPTTYSYIKTEDDGTTTIKRRHKATNMRATVTMPRQSADEALRRVQEVLDVPVAFIAESSTGFDGLNVFGLGTAQVSYDGAIANMQVNVRGMI